MALLEVTNFSFVQENTPILCREKSLLPEICDRGALKEKQLSCIAM